MDIEDDLAADLKDDEGNKTHPYTDSVGITTIGVGRNLEDNGLRQSEIDFMLKNDIDGVFSDLNSNLPWWSNMDRVRQLVLANMCFNLGIETLLEFKNTLHEMQNGNYAAAASSMRLSKWFRQVKSRGERLADEMETGIRK